MPSIRNVLTYGLAVVPAVPGHTGKEEECKDFGNLKLAPQRGAGKSGQGGPGGFCTGKLKQGVLINGMECWADKDSLRGLKFYYTDGSQMMVGKQDNLNGRVVNSRVNWDPTNQRIDWINLHVNSWDGGMGAIDMQVEGGKRMICDKMDESPSFRVNLGARGMMLAAEGQAGDLIDNIRFIFTANVNEPTGIQVKSTDLLKSPNEGVKYALRETLHFISRQENDTLVVERRTKSYMMHTKRTLDFSDTEKFGFEQMFNIGVHVPDLPLDFRSQTDMKWSSEKVTREEDKKEKKDDKKKEDEDKNEEDEDKKKEDKDKKIGDKNNKKKEEEDKEKKDQGKKKKEDEYNNKDEGEDENKEE